MISSLAMRLCVAAVVTFAPGLLGKAKMDLPKAIKYSTPPLCSDDVERLEYKSIEVELQIDSSGKVSSASLINGINGDFASRFTVDEMNRWEFEPFTGRAMTITVSAVYKRQGDNWFLEVEPLGLKVPLNVQKRGEPFDLLPKDFKEGVTECPVHQWLLEVEKQPVQYGLIISAGGWQPSEHETKEKFPFANSETFGGCVISCAMPTEAIVAYCQKCRALRSEWIDLQSQKNRQERKK